ncbi:serine/arginine-rich splicing factor 11-like [Scleropages formosus]|uniref:Serine/arginine-rich splicing factor 11-like n=1 Tax=Scleropages formosus TaxID=113540 RepID=A0A0P7UTM4_SCLFO|nr:serine/arginine-rich splicing factor 11-like [Scleropages formosus]
MNSNTNVIQVTNVSPSTTSEQMRTLFGFLGKIEELKLFPPDDSPLPVTSRVCFVKFLESESVGVSQHLTNTVFVDRALIVVPYAEGVIPDEAKALSLLAPANAVAGLLPGGGLLPTPNPLASIGGVPLAALGGPTLDPALAALGLPGSNMNSQSLTADQLLKLMTTVDPKLNHMAAGMNLNPGLKADSSSKEIEEAMKRVREAQSLISAAIEPGMFFLQHQIRRMKNGSIHAPDQDQEEGGPGLGQDIGDQRADQDGGPTQGVEGARKVLGGESLIQRREAGGLAVNPGIERKRRRLKSALEPPRRATVPPGDHEALAVFVSVMFSPCSRRRRSRSASRSPKKSRSPKRKVSRSPSPRRHKKEKKKDKDRERERDKDRERKEEKDRNRGERERSTSKKKKNKDKDKDREKKSDSEKGDVKVTRDYDEEEQGYDSEKERGEKQDLDPAMSPDLKGSPEKGTGEVVKEPKVNGDDHHEEDMDMSE